MGYWAKPAFDRTQASFSLDQSIPQNHPVRHLDEILRNMDWSTWTQTYNGKQGQPPIPPWIIAAVILYGLMRGIRSSRQLEYVCLNNIDFMWLAEGRTIDYSRVRSLCCA